MPGPPKIPDVEWNLHKANIHSLYVTENKTLGQMMECVASQSGFRPSKAQYIRQLRKWGFDKNSSANQWKQVAKVVRKRKHEGKDSEVFIRDDRVSAQKLRKEISRYAVHEESRECSSPRLEDLDGIVVQTPMGDIMQHTVSLCTPWLDFQNRIEPYLESLRKLYLESAAPDPLLHQQKVYSGYDVPSEVPWNLEMGHWAIPGHQWIPSYTSCTDYTSPKIISFGLPDESQVPLIATDETSDEVTALLAEFIGAATDSKVDKLVEWMIGSGTQWVLGDLLDLKTPTTEIFGSAILVSAASLGSMDIVRILIAKKIDVNVMTGYDYRRTALREATKNQHPRMVELLLDAGASLEQGHEIPRSLLYDALAGSHSIEIVDMLIKKGMDVNDATLPEEYECTALVYAAEKHDLAMVRMLLGAGANVNEMLDSSITALQASIGEDGLDVALALIDAGASIDAPMGDIFADARKDSEEFREFHRLTTPIQRAAMANDVELVQFLLSEGADVNACPWEGCKDEIRKLLAAPWCDEDKSVYFEYQAVMTVLQAAAFNRNSTLVRVVLGADADVNARGSGDTPLQLAAAKGDAKICHILLRYGADINAPADAQFGRTALHAAATRGDDELVQQLLHAGADVDAVASPTGGRTALQAAVGHGSIELVKTLIEAGGNINIAASAIAGRTCLQAAAEYGHVELVQFLLSAGADVNSPAALGSEGLTALQAAVSPYPCSCSDNLTQAANKRLARARIVQILLNAGADVNTPQSADRETSALVTAISTHEFDLKNTYVKNHSHSHAVQGLVEQRIMETVALLIEAGADVNGSCSTTSCDVHKSTPLGEAAGKGFVQIATMLLNAGAQVNLPIVGSEFTALHCASYFGRAAMVQFLLDRGADPNACCPNGSTRTPLQVALERSDTNNEIVSALIDAGADVNGTPCIRLAAEAGNGQAIRLLLKAGAHINSGLQDGSAALCNAIREYNIDLIKLLIEAGADVNGPTGSEYRRTVLQEAVTRRDVDLIKLLIEAGADVNAPAGATYGRTALQRAAENGDIGVLRLIMAHGADINAPAGRWGGVTALQGAAAIGHLKIVLMLLEAGAHVNAPPATHYGKTALDAAAENGRLDIVVLLLNNDDDAEGIDVRCKRAAELAASNSHSVIARILREHCANQGSTA